MPAYLRSHSSKDKTANNAMSSKEQEKTTPPLNPTPAESPVFTLGAATSNAKYSKEASDVEDGHDLKFAALTSQIEAVALASSEAKTATLTAVSALLKDFQGDIAQSLKTFQQKMLAANAATAQRLEESLQQKDSNPSPPPPSASISPSGLAASPSKSTPAPSLYPFASLGPAVEGVGRPSGVKSTPVLRARELFGFFMNGCT